MITVNTIFCFQNDLKSLTQIMKNISGDVRDNVSSLDGTLVRKLKTNFDIILMFSTINFLLIVIYV